MNDVYIPTSLLAGFLENWQTCDLVECNSTRLFSWTNGQLFGIVNDVYIPTFLLAGFLENWQTRDLVEWGRLRKVSIVLKLLVLMLLWKAVGLKLILIPIFNHFFGALVNVYFRYEALIIFCFKLFECSFSASDLVFGDDKLCNFENDSTKANNVVQLDLWTLQRKILEHQPALVGD